jgi:hypothetical protein
MERSRKAKRMLGLALVVLMASVAILGAPRIACAFGFCGSCTQQCANEAEGVYIDCMHQTTKPMAQCAQEKDNYYASCSSIFCPGCPLIY